MFNTSFITPLNLTTQLQSRLESELALSDPQVSAFRVSALAESTDLHYLGVNLEFPMLEHAQTIHAEQFAVALARQNGASLLHKLTLTQWPCGHCRQFLLELGDPHLLEIVHIGSNTNATLGKLLPHAFELSTHKPNFWLPADDIEELQTLCIDNALLADIAKKAALLSYSPYTQTQSGVALKTKHGDIFWGSLIESAAFNPSLPPLQAALCQWWAHTQGQDKITEIVLAEPSSNVLSYITQSNALAQHLGATFATSISN